MEAQVTPTASPGNFFTRNRTDDPYNLFIIKYRNLS